MIRLLSLGTAMLALAACMDSGGSETASANVAPNAQTTLRAPDGDARGSARLSEDARGIAVDVNAEGLTAGTHGIHIHTTGRCDAPDFASAGAHWNPTDRQHGRQNPQGAHHGDLPNITIGADGRGSLRFILPEARFAQLFDADGAALVVHASADDQRSEPSGNSGGRVACGVIERR